MSKKKNELKEITHEVIAGHLQIVELGYKQLLSTAQGRALAYSIIADCGIFQADPLDEKVIMFNAGKRNMGLKLLADIEFYDPEAMLKMIQEDANRKKEIAIYERTNNRDANTGSEPNTYPDALV